jgi:hypothetical protein
VEEGRERRWGLLALRATYAGLVGWFGTTYRIVNIDDVGVTWGEAAKEFWPVAPALTALVLVGQWLVTAFARRFPKWAD